MCVFKPMGGLLISCSNKIKVVSSFIIKKVNKDIGSLQRKRGDSGLFMTLVPKVLIGWFIKLSVHTFKPLIVIYRKVNFVGKSYICTGCVNFF